MSGSNEPEGGETGAGATGTKTRRRRPKRAVDYGILPKLIGYNLRRAQVRNFQMIGESVGAFDITPGQFGVLVIINANPGLNQSELGNAMNVDRSTVVAVIDRLEKRNLVVRDPSPMDRRSYALRLSDEGDELLAKLVPLVQGLERDMAKDLSDKEVETLVGMLKRMTVR